MHISNKRRIWRVHFNGDSFDNGKIQHLGARVRRESIVGHVVSYGVPENSASNIVVLKSRLIPSIQNTINDLNNASRHHNYVVFRPGLVIRFQQLSMDDILGWILMIKANNDHGWEAKP